MLLFTLFIRLGIIEYSHAILAIGTIQWNIVIIVKFMMIPVRVLLRVYFGLVLFGEPGLCPLSEDL